MFTVRADLVFCSLNLSPFNEMMHVLARHSTPIGFFFIIAYFETLSFPHIWRENTRDLYRSTIFTSVKNIYLTLITTIDIVWHRIGKWHTLNCSDKRKSSEWSQNKVIYILYITYQTNFLCAYKTVRFEEPVRYW